jgi:hypothetical protein
VSATRDAEVVEPGIRNAKRERAKDERERRPGAPFAKDPPVTLRRVSAFGCSRLPLTLVFPLTFFQEAGLNDSSRTSVTVVPAGRTTSRSLVSIAR